MPLLHLQLWAKRCSSENTLPGSQTWGHDQLEGPGYGKVEVAPFDRVGGSACNLAHVGDVAADLRKSHWCVQLAADIRLALHESVHCVPSNLQHAMRQRKRM
jgi:hypothetical protein